MLIRLFFPRDFNSDYSNGRGNKTRCVPVLLCVISIERGCGKERAGLARSEQEPKAVVGSGREQGPKAVLATGCEQESKAVLGNGKSRELCCEVAELDIVVRTGELFG